MSPALIAYGALGFAILFEVSGSALLMKTEQFTRPLPTLVMALLYAISFYCLSHALKGIPLSIAYAIWAGLGIILTALVGLLIFRQPIDTPAMIGIGLIVSGVLVINLFSHTASH
ncbi:multidrug efflux SMR transporter [Castellaniella sp.]|uniref:DMT family transporter n=1 Tax=Castellaniella sp. TaxID=1955812 RepID=UPI002AFF8769|nr:multidrug efflux SMR transporter [Castellaniella sp.]